MRSPGSVDIGLPQIYSITADHVREIKMKSKKKKLLTELFFIISVILLFFSSGVRTKQSYTYKERVTSSFTGLSLFPVNSLV